MFVEDCVFGSSKSQQTRSGVHFIRPDVTRLLEGLAAASLGAIIGATAAQASRSRRSGFRPKCSTKDISYITESFMKMTSKCCVFCSVNSTGNGPGVS